jgi:glycosyltransferase involved in cell wall biosynthesis
VIVLKILVYPHDLALGGSQLNAIEIASAVASQGHEVAVFGRPGALVSRIHQLGLEFIEAPQPGRRPSPTVVAALERLIDEREIDVVHGYEWPPALEARLAVRHRRSTAAVATVMSMAVAPFIPRAMPLLVGTQEIADAERASGRRRVGLLEPPVDLVFNDSDADVGQAEFRRRFGLDQSRFTVTAVTRFAHELKLEGTLTAIAAVAAVNDTVPVRLVLVGDGPARHQVEDSAREVNERVGRGTIVLTGQLDDPRAAYATADLALGMGGSALRALAFRRALVVQGERGFWQLLTPESSARFLVTGWYGIGGSPAEGAPALERILRDILPDSRLRAELGNFGRDLVEHRFSLERAAVLQIEQYRLARERPAGWTESLRADSAAFLRYGAYYFRKRVRRARGTEPADDFNAVPVRSRAPEASSPR